MREERDALQRRLERQLEREQADALRERVRRAYPELIIPSPSPVRHSQPNPSPRQSTPSRFSTTTEHTNQETPSILRALTAQSPLTPTPVTITTSQAAMNAILEKIMAFTPTMLHERQLAEAPLGFVSLGQPDQPQESNPRTERFQMLVEVQRNLNLDFNLISGDDDECLLVSGL